MSALISFKNTIIPAWDLPLDDLSRILKVIAPSELIGAHKLGFGLGLGHGLPSVVSRIREFSTAPIIYDHQKAGTDIPETGSLFAKTMRKAHIDAAILFPMAGPVTAQSWVKALHDAEIHPILGLSMTHKGYHEDDGGWISSQYASGILSCALEEGVRDFVVPGNKPSVMRFFAEKLVSLFGDDAHEKCCLYSPGLLTQGGLVEDALSAVGRFHWHAIVGRSLYNSKSPLDTLDQFGKAFSQS